MYSALWPAPGQAAAEAERRAAVADQTARKFGGYQPGPDLVMPEAAAPPLAVTGAVAAGIDARRAERIRADPADPAAGQTDDQLFDRLFGRLRAGVG